MQHVHTYKAKVVWTGGANGPTADYESYSRQYQIEIDGKVSITGSADHTFRGDYALHNPEDMLLAALSGCHMLSYLALAARSGVKVQAYEDNATAVMKNKDGKIKFTDATLCPVVTISDDSDFHLATELHEKAHSECFIANSVNFQVGCQPIIQKG